MAVPCNFEESNEVIDRPEGLTEEQCGVLSVFKAVDQKTQLPCVVSCWKITQEELDEINRTGRIWLVLYGKTMPPAIVTTIKKSIIR